MPADYASFIESLQIPASSLVAAGTIRLPAVLVAARALHACGTWLEYSPGDLRDPPEVLQRLAVEEVAKSRSQPVANSPKNSLKRKRSSSSFVSGGSDGLCSSSGASLTEETRLPSIDELDRLASHAFVKLEYMLHSSDLGSSRCQALFRVFLVPMDAPGLNARIIGLKLKIRLSAVKLYAQKVMARLLHNLRYDTLEWATGVLQDSAQPLLTHVQVSATHD